MKKTSSATQKTPGGPKRSKRKKEIAKQLNITSLLDIMTILLVFMIKNVSMDVYQKDQPAGMLLPRSISKDELQERNQVLYVKIYPDRILYGSDNMKVGAPDELFSNQNMQNVLIEYLKKDAKYIKKNNQKPSILIQADRQVQCKYITAFIKLSTRASIADVYFSTIKTNNKDLILGKM